MWIFGYGSLVWRPSLPFIERHWGFVDGWSRRFWQGSPDPRGVEEAPGRVVTLVADRGARCWGMAYRIAPQSHAEVVAMLDHREKGGYQRHVLRVELPGSRHVRVRAMSYIATADNPSYLGPAPLDAIAEQVRASSGPSGSNVEYVERLCAALRSYGVDDQHVFEVERLL